MIEDPFSLSYVGTGCNKSAQVMDWGDGNLVCFGACNSVALYDPSQGRILRTLTGHKSDVTCVRWLRGPGSNQALELVSGSSDSSLMVWTLKKEGCAINRSVVSLSGHEATILAVDGLRVGVSGAVVVSSAADNTIRIWRRTDQLSDFILQKIIKTGSSFIFCLNMIMVPKSTDILLSYGTDTSEVVFHSIGQNDQDSILLAKTSGHEDWIRCIDMKVLNNGEILVASSSQDMMIRISRLTTRCNDATDESFNLKKVEIHIGGFTYYLCLESVLYGHEGWVYGVSWSPFEENNSPFLLSASFDRTLIIWKSCPDSGLWLEDSRMGEMGGDNTLGYYGARFSPDGLSVLAHSYQGSFHLWRQTDSKWIADFVIGGHFDAVTDISWEESGRYLVSVSSDKTTRLHTTCLKGTPFSNSPWCEVSRPQIHGHALHSVAVLKKLGFASCSEEKVIRVFMPSINVLKLLNCFSENAFSAEEKDCKSLPTGASITALGLSNKATFESENEKVDPEVEPLPINDFDTPHEDYLVQNTLWPEIMKLYGHGNDVFAVAASHDGKILASAAKATSADQAKIILWDTNTWNIISKLDGHQLTVTQLKFSPNDMYLLSVSRDRKWCLFKKTNDTYVLHLTSKKDKVMHSRIIWTCCWTYDSLYFATGSRDCKIIGWDLEKPVFNLNSDCGSVTALDFGPVQTSDNKYLLAAGYESGALQIFSWSLDSSITTLFTIPPDLSHHLTVQGLQFRPVLGRTGEKTESESETLQLASCSDDRSVRIYAINLSKL